MKKTIHLLLMTMVMTLGASAQEKITLTLDEALAIAMKNNIQVITAQNTYNAAVADVLPKTWGNNLPTVDLNAQYSLADEKSTFVTNSGVKESAERYSYSLSANYVLFDGFKKFGEMKQARLDESSAQFTYENTKQDVALQVHKSYFDVLKNQQLLRVSEENLKRSEEQLKRLEERNRLGAQILSDVYKQKVQVGSDRLALNRSKNNLNTSKASLNSLIGIDVNTQVELKDLGLDVTFDASEYNFDKAFSKALEQRKDYLASIKKVESSRASLRNARSGFFPTLSAFADYSWSDAFRPGSFKEIGANDRVSVGLNFSMPIFNGFQTSASVIRADQSVQTAKSNLENTRRQVALNIKIALLNLQTSYENVKLSEENVNSAKEDLRLATEKYNLGAGTILDQITANASYAQAEANHIQAVYDFLYAKQQFNIAVGAIETK
ncbi:TolC family protein [bacterium]|nr:TolC family protein [bacterium]